MANAPKSTESNATLRIRRAPKYRTFMFVGVGLGVAAAFIIDALFANNPVPVGGSVPVAGILGYLVLFLGLLGGGLGVVAAVVLDRIFTATAKQVPATKLEG